MSNKWRPAGWKNPADEVEKQLKGNALPERVRVAIVGVARRSYEAGADKIIEALLAEGQHVNSYQNFGEYPPIPGTYCFIPDDTPQNLTTASDSNESGD